MNLRDIIQHLDKSKSNEVWADDEEMREKVGLDSYSDTPEDFKEVFKVYWISKHLCTDTWVGIKAYFLNGVHVCCSQQSGRKCDKNFYWVSDDTFQMVFQYLSKTVSKKHISILDFEEDFEGGYTVSYGSQLLTNKGFYNGEIVEVIKTYGDRYEGDSETWHTVDVKLPSGDVVNIHLDDFKIPYCVTGSEVLLIN
jgi:hypothetical protein